MKEFRVGIIGAGAISHRHMKIYTNIPAMKIVAVAEIDKARLDQWSQQYDIKDTYTDFREMLKRDDIDVIDVCVHNNLHAPIAIAVMKAGKACYLEKPMSASYADSKLVYDCWKKTNVKFANQISSLFSGQTKIGRKLIEDGVLGDIYHTKVASAFYRRRPSIDFIRHTPDFVSKKIAGHGQIIDLGIYDFGQMLFLLGLPQLKSVYGKIYHKMDSPIKGRVIEVEDMGVGLAEFPGITMELMQSGATNMEKVGHSYITGTKGALEIIGADTFGGEWSMGDERGLLSPPQQPKLRFTGEYKGIHIDCDLKAYENQVLQRTYDPEQMMWFDNQMHWYKYLCGDLSEEDRYNTPLVGLNVSLLVDGLVLSDQLGRSVTADEIKEKSESMAIWKQDTPWGIFDYENTF